MLTIPPLLILLDLTLYIVTLLLDQESIDVNTQDSDCQTLAVLTISTGMILI